MKKLICILLIVLGVVEVVYGLMWGGLQIYAHEAPFAQALRLQQLSDEQVHAYNHYIRLFKDQWHIVAVFGVLTVIGALALWRLDTKRH
ncbi:MAG: hypothetical protein ACXWC8_14545 [Limisphaerales bacterium]